MVNKPLIRPYLWGGGGTWYVRGGGWLTSHETKAPRSEVPQEFLNVGDESQLSNEKNPGWLGYIRDYTTQLDRDYNEP